MSETAEALQPFSEATRRWFTETFETATGAQQAAWPAIARGEHTLLLSPTGSGKTLAAFLAGLDQVLFNEPEAGTPRCRVLYLSPIKALAFDVERNLRAPLAGIARTADRLGLPRREIQVAMRTGDTPSEERNRFSRRGADILITTPESLYLLLTSQAARQLTHVDTVIVDEVHAIAGQKRGTHLLLSLERLDSIQEEGPVQRVGLSATQRPLSRIATWLGGYNSAQSTHSGALAPRPVTILDAHSTRHIELTIEVPVDDMSELSQTERILSPVEGEPTPPASMWTAIHPRLLELVRAHRTTMVFVNNRRLAERLAAALNELAEATIARAHHGSVAREERAEIEDALKRGALPCIVATSSLELGLDIGAVELVVQIESPPSVSSGIQRIGRANHQVGGNPKGVLFPKHRADLLACAEAACRMMTAEVESTTYPENALDVLAQQCVATVASEQASSVEALFSLVRRAAPYAKLTREQLESVLDMLSGRYPSDEFGELRPRLIWDRDSGELAPRKGAKRLCVQNPGVIPDRGLYGVFLLDGEGKSRRVGELDEEMVFEAREGEVFVLGASSWRIEEITHDRVLVSPAPGQPGKMPFWHGDGLGRSVELGRGIGHLIRTVLDESDSEATARLTSDAHRLDARAAQNLVRFIREQDAAPNAAPTDQQVVVETFLDELGDYRVCLLSPFGLRVHTPLGLCIMEKAQRDLSLHVEVVWMDDGLVMRFPESDEPPDLLTLLPTPDELEELLTHTLADTPLFAAHFRECAGRSLLLPKRNPQRRAPLWAQRKRAAHLLSVASRYPAFPIVLETYRECMQDVFDLPALSKLLSDVRTHKIRIASVRTERPSPFATSLLFNYVGNFMYDQDAPLAERRAAALSIDLTQLRELLGQADLKDLLDGDSIAEVEHNLLRLSYPPRHEDELHDLLLLIGDLSQRELTQRMGESTDALIAPLLKARRAVQVRIAGETRLIAAEDAARYRDALGVMPPAGLPSAFLEPATGALSDLISRYARTHGPFSQQEFLARYPAPADEVNALLDRRVAAGRLLRGELHPNKDGITYCDVDVMRAIKRRALSQLRKEIEPVSAEAYARYLLAYHGVQRSRPVNDGLHGALERLQGLPLYLEDLERHILPARFSQFTPSDLDHMMATGEILWRGMGESGEGGRIALFFREDYALLSPLPTPASGPHVERVRETLQGQGAMFFSDLARNVGAFPPDVLTALWTLVWAGEVTNDSLLPLRSLGRKQDTSSSRRRRGSKAALPGSEGRWSLLPEPDASTTERRAALTETLLLRHGILMRDALKSEGIQGGFSAAYEVLKAMEDVGKVRRGYFVEGLGAAQFAFPGNDELLRAQRDVHLERSAKAVVLSASDPANPYGSTLRWPETPHGRPARALGTSVVLGPDGKLLAYLGKHGRSLLSFIQPAEEPLQAERLAEALRSWALDRRGSALLVGMVDGQEPQRSPLLPALQEAGFVITSRGLQWRRRTDPRAADHDAPN